MTPAHGEVTVSWDEVPGAERYDIFEFSYGQLRTDVQRPYPWTGLDDGQIYAFQVTAVMPEGTGAHAVSARVEAMPLSVRTFAPWVREVGYRSITIEWWDNPNVSKYTVDRGMSADGPWEVYRSLAGGEFTDAQLDHDTEYYYRITPEVFSSTASDPVSATPGRFGHEVLSRIGTDRIFDVAAEASGLAVIDISDPLHPGMPVYRATAGPCLGVAVAGSYAYAAIYGLGLAIIDISDPLHPGVPTYVQTTGDPDDVAVAGSFAYVATRSTGLAVIDISDPGNPGTPVYSATTGNASGVAVKGSHAYVAATSSGLAIIDVSDPRSPGAATYCTTLGLPQKVAVSGSYAYVAVGDSGGDSGLAIIDISDPLNPGLPIYVSTSDISTGIAVGGSFAYLAARGSGFAIVKLLE